MESKYHLKQMYSTLRNKHQDAFMIFLIKLDYSKLHSLYVQRNRDVFLLN